MGIELIGLINTITYEWILDEDMRAKYQRLGVNPKLWPMSDAKKHVRSFESGVLTDNVRYEVVQWYDALESGFKADISGSEIEFQARYENLMQYAVADQLIETLRNDRKNWMLHCKNAISEYGSAMIDVFSAFESIEHQAKESRELSKSNIPPSVKIPDFEKLSECIGGWNGGRITMIGAATGFGKTSFAISVARKAVEVMPVLMVNQELSEADFSIRSLTILTKLTRDEIYNAFQDEQVDVLEILERERQNARFNWHITGGQSLSLLQIDSLVRSYMRETPGLLVIDYDQKIKVPLKDAEWKEIYEVVQSLEDLAKETKIHVLLLCQTHEGTHQIKSSRRIAQSVSTFGVLMDNNQEQSTWKQLLQGGDKAQLGFWKTRFANRDKVIEFDYDKKTGLFVEGEVKEDPSWRP